MKKDNFLYWIWLSEAVGDMTHGVGALCEQYEDPFDIYRLDEEELAHLEGISPVVRDRLGDKALDGAYEILCHCRRRNMDIVTYRDPRYPMRLRTLEDPPVLLYCLGQLPDMNRRLCVAMVGTRSMSEYGKQTAYRMGYELAAGRVVVVSGMALGVDAVAACGALEAGGSTVAVLGCGLDTVYPKEHKHLMQSIIKHGAVVTEYPPSARPVGQHFPRRNRIISGLCQGTLVVEGAKGSGALITASHAIAQGRDLFALPGKVNESNSEGPNELICNGAHATLSAEDILCFYDFLYHDDTDVGALKRATRSSTISDGILRRYGVSPERGRKAEGASAQAVSVTPPIAEAEAVPVYRDEPKPNAAEPRREEPVAKRDGDHPDQSERLLASVDATTQRVFSLMPTDRAVTPDYLAAEGVEIGDVITSLTLLEIVGLVSALPGGLYVRK